MNMLFNFSYTLRSIGKNINYASLCALVVALSVGISIVVFSLVYNTQIKSLPFNDSERWFYLHRVDLRDGSEYSIDSIDQYTYQFVKQRLTGFSKFGMFQGFARTRLSNGDSSRRVPSIGIEPGILQATGIKPFLGRFFSEEDGTEGAARAAIISHSLWTDEYSGDANIIGRQIEIDGLPTTVVGVMPEDEFFILNYDIWLPKTSPLLAEPDLDTVPITPVGILKEGVAIETVELEIEKVMAELQRDIPDIYATRGVAVSPLNQALTESSGGLFSAMLVVSAVIVLLACINIGNLLVVRLMERNQEFAVRSAVGSSRWQLIRQALHESLLICLAGAILGALIGLVGLLYMNMTLEIATQSIPGGAPARWHLAPNLSFFATAFVLILVVWLLSGAIPAWVSSRIDASSILSGASKSSNKRGGSKVVKALVGFEVVSACMLLIICSVATLAISNVFDVDYAMDTKNKLAVEIELPSPAYDDQERRNLIFGELQDSIRRSMSAAQVAMTSHLPSEVPERTYKVEGQGDEGAAYPEQNVISVSTNYFELLGIDLLEGRLFDGSDVPSTQNVAVVDDLFAKKTWPSTSAIGKRIQLNPENNGPWLTVVGVVSHSIQSTPLYGGQFETTLFRPLLQDSERVMNFIVPTTASISTFMNELREILASSNRDIIADDVTTLDEFMNRPTASIGLFADIFIFVALVTLVLAVSGTYGVISRGVMQRKMEAGIRRAMGCSDGGVMLLYLRQGLVFLLCGIFIGGAGGVSVSSSLTGLFSDVMPSIPLIFLVIAVGMAVLIGISCYLPIRKILGMEPGDALRQL